MNKIEKIKPEGNETAAGENVHTWQDDLANQPHLDSNSTIVENQIGDMSRTADSQRVKLG